MEIIQVKNDKKKYLDLLLLADKQEDMVDRYLERGDVYKRQIRSVVTEVSWILLRTTIINALEIGRAHV